MKELIEDRFNTLALAGTGRQNPIQSNLMLKMIRAGYSRRWPCCARTHARGPVGGRIGAAG